MKKKILSFIVKPVIAVAAFALLAACSDGAHIQPKMFSPSVSEPVVEFTVTKADGSTTPGSSVLISAGESIKVAWSVSMGGEENADGGDGTVAPKAAEGDEKKDDAGSGMTVTLDSEALGVHEENLPVSGEKQYDDVKVEAIFVLTVAYGDKTVSRQVSIEVEEPRADMDATFNASPASVYKGESTDICWDVSREDAKITIVDSNGKTLVEDGIVMSSDSAPVENEENLVEGEELTENIAAAVPKAAEAASQEGSEVGAKDCITVSPVKDTTYYLTARSGKDSIDKEVTVDVMVKLEIVEFTADPATVAGEQEVTLAWKVLPAEATVTIEGMEDTFSSEDSVKVTVDNTATFTLTASYEDQSVQQTLTVSLESKALTLTPIVNGTKLVAEGDTASALDAGTFFEGEKVKVGWEASLGSLTENIKVTVGGTSGEYGATGEVEVPVSGSGQVALTATVEGLPSVTKTVTLNVRKWVGTAAREDGAAASEIAPVSGSTDSAWVGFRGDLAAGGILKIVRMVASGDSITNTLLDIPFQSLFESDNTYGMAGKWNPSFIKDLNTYPVNTIAMDTQGRVFVGTAGGIVYSDDNGATWKGLVFGYKYNDGSYTGSHRSCKGKTQEGYKNNDNFPVTLTQVCDIVIGSNGKFAAATDHFVVWLNSGVDTHLADKKANGWVGIPAPGKDGNEVYATVSHDLELVALAGSQKLYDATDKGLFVTPFESAAFAWTKVSGIDGAVLSISSDPAAGKLYAGTESGLYVGNINGTGWTKLNGISETVYDVKADPVQLGSLYVATGAGVKLSRDSGVTWIDITKGAMEGSATVESLSVSKVGDTVGIFAATDKGGFASVAKATVGQAVVLENGNGESTDNSGEGGSSVETPEPEVPDVAGPTIGGEGSSVTATDAMGSML